jgi:hypothetical protein
MSRHHCVRHTLLPLSHTTKTNHPVTIHNTSKYITKCATILTALNTAVCAFRPACRQRRESRDVHWHQPSACTPWHVEQRSKLVCVQIIAWLWAGRSRDRIPMGARFSAPGANPASCTVGTGSFPGVESGRGLTLTPHPLLVPRSKNRVELYLSSP